MVRCMADGRMVCVRVRAFAAAVKRRYPLSCEEGTETVVRKWLGVWRGTACLGQEEPPLSCHVWVKF